MLVPLVKTLTKFKGPWQAAASNSTNAVIESVDVGDDGENVMALLDDPVGQLAGVGGPDAGYMQKTGGWEVTVV